jgi:hypothetical protein
MIRPPNQSLTFCIPFLIPFASLSHPFAPSTPTSPQIYALHATRKTGHARAAAGCRVTHGQIDLTNGGKRFRVLRAGTQLWEGELVSLKHVRDEVQLMKKGGECGVTLAGFSDYQRGDVVQQMAEKRTRRLVKMPVFDLATLQLDQHAFGAGASGRTRGISGASSSSSASSASSASSEASEAAKVPL